MKLDPDPNPDPHQSEKVEALEGHWSIGVPNLGGNEW